MSIPVCSSGIKKKRQFGTATCNGVSVQGTKPHHAARVPRVSRCIDWSPTLKVCADYSPNYDIAVAVAVAVAVAAHVASCG